MTPKVSEVNTIFKPNYKENILNIFETTDKQIILEKCVRCTNSMKRLCKQNTTKFVEI